jgi:hypothetical protein
MNVFLEQYGVCMISNELLQLLEFMYGYSLEASQVMEDRSVIAPENQFILNVMFPALVCVCQSDARQVRVPVFYNLK